MLRLKNIERLLYFLSHGACSSRNLFFSNTINFTDSQTYEPVDHSDCSLIKWEGQPP